MKYYLFFLFVISLYAGLSWFTLREQSGRSKLIFYVSSLCMLAILSTAMYTNLFFTLFIAVLIVVVALYIGDASKLQKGKIIKNGVFGGLWLSIPIYIYFVANT